MATAAAVSSASIVACVPAARPASSSSNNQVAAGCLRTYNQPRPRISLARRRGAVQVQARGSAATTQQTTSTADVVITKPALSRDDFPPGFLFGTATSAFQVEGHVDTGGKGMSIWDAFVQYPGNITNGDMPTVACNFYELYPEDVQLMKKMGCDTVRFSIAWSRIIPNETGEVSQEGIAFYNRLINEIIKAGMKPFATIFHWDLPLFLENDPEVLGWRTKNIVKHYTKYAETCFRYFGDRVKYWITFNEPFVMTVNAYVYGGFAPGRCSAASGNVCHAGDSSTEPYLAIHHIILSHASAYRLYQAKYQKEQGGYIGYTANGIWLEPYSDAIEDVHATARYLDFTNGWQMDPLFFGDYPKTMRDRLGNRLPTFTEEEAKDVKGSLDFLGLNYYSTSYVKNDPSVKTPSTTWYFNDMDGTTTVIDVNGNPIGEQMGSSSSIVYNYAQGLYKLLVWAEERWGTIPKYITENGCMDPDASASANEIVLDSQRMGYLYDHISALSKAIKDKNCNVKGYFAWSLMDNFEWSVGFSDRYGLFYIDFNDPKLTRIPKGSAKWYAKLLGGDISDDEKVASAQESSKLSALPQLVTASNGSAK